ncbi:cold shock domain-containing protein [uncultured Photobacterium sp.]|uniref:cold-shock protein n=1 Tax=uncultured Photobacterium sp. TaxID=173973 RepID=UPI00262F455B|nr:cold shock domain-containing protein [uncultured Photobacterium sp.]
MIGIVKWFDRNKGIGFVNEFNLATESIANSLDIFVHYNDINAAGFKVLNQGELVRFELVTTNKGPQARSVNRFVKEEKPC